MILREEYRALLQRLTAAHNAEVEQNYLDGMLDFVPQPMTDTETLELILSSYALEHYPEVMTMTEYKPINKDYDNIDLFELEQRLYDAKEILRYLAETFPTFDAELYMNGSTILQNAGSFIDSEIHNPTVIR